MNRKETVEFEFIMNSNDARKRLSQLDEEAYKLRAQMKGLKKDSQEYIEASKKLKEVENQMVEVRKHIDLTKLSLKELRAEARRLESIKANLDPTTQAFRDVDGKLKDVTKRMGEVKSGLSPFQKAWGNLKEELLGLNGAILAVFGGSMVLDWIGGLVSKRTELSDAIADIAKASGMTTAAAKQTDDALKSLDTRTPIDKLRAMAVEAGKAGAATPKAILEEVKKSNEIIVALGDDLGEEAVTQMGKLSEIYGEGMRNIASGVNDVADKSRASARYQVDFMYRMDGVAKSAKIAAGDILGYGAALELNGQQTETASTALNQFFIEFVKDSEKFGQAAGMAKGELDKLIQDKGTNEAFVTFLENLNNVTGGGKKLLLALEQLGIDGARGANTFLALASSTKLVREQQEIANKAIREGSSVTVEYNKRNENFAGVVERIQKNMSLWLSQSTLAKTLERWITWFDKMTHSTTKAQDELANLNQEFNREIYVLNNANLTQTERSRLIGDINQKYGEYLPRLISEKDSLTDILAIQEEVNKQMLSKIMLMNYEEEIKKILEAQAKALEGQYNIKKKVAELGGSRSVDSKQNIETNIKTSRIDTRATEGMSPQQVEAMQNQLNLVNQINTGIVDGTDDALKSVEDKYRSMAEAMGMVWDQIKSKTTSAIKSGTLNMEGLSSTEEKLKEKVIKDNQELSARIMAMRQDFLDSQLSDNEKELVAIQNKWQAIIDKTVKGTAMEAEAYDAMNEEILAAIKKQGEKEAELVRKNLEEKTRIAADNYQKAQVELMSDMDREIFFVEQHYQEIIDLVGVSAAQEVELEAKKQEAITSIRTKYLLMEGKSLQQGQRSWKSFFKASSDNMKGWQSDLKDALEVVGQFWNTLSGLLDSYTAREQEKSQQRLDALNKEYDYKDQKLEESYQKGLISELKYNSEKNKLDRERAEKDRQIKMEMFERQKQADTAKAFVNVALGVTQAIAEYPWPYSLIVAGIVAAAGAIEIDKINSQTPSFGKGKIFDKGPKHSDAEGGLHVIDPRTGDLEALFEVGEGLVNADSVSQTPNRRILEWMNANPGKVYRPQYVSTIGAPVNFDKGITNTSISSFGSGFLPQQSSSTSSSPYYDMAVFQKQMEENNRLLGVMISEIKAMGDKKSAVVFSLQRLNEAQQEFDELQSFGGI